MRAGNAKIKILDMKLILLISCFSLFIGKHGTTGKQYYQADSVYIKLPGKYDTLNVSFIGKNIARVILDKYSQKLYKAPQGISLDIQRTASFSIPKSNLPRSIKQRIIDIAIISDSVSRVQGIYLRRHQFFVISEQNHTMYFYEARGEYLNKNQ